MDTSTATNDPFLDDTNSLLGRNQPKLPTHGNATITTPVTTHEWLGSRSKQCNGPKQHNKYKHVTVKDVKVQYDLDPQSLNDCIYGIGTIAKHSTLVSLEVP